MFDLKPYTASRPGACSGPLAVLSAAVLVLGCSDCCSARPKWESVDTAGGIHVYGTLDFGAGPKPARTAKKIRSRAHDVGLVVALAAPSGAKRRVFDSSTVDQEEGGWAYGAIVPSGDYELLVLADRHRDGKVGRGDVVGRVALHVPADSFLFEGPVVPVDLSAPTDAGFAPTLEDKAVARLWKGLDDPFFDPSWGELGLVFPTRTLSHIDDDFVFGLLDEKGQPAWRRGEPRARLFQLLVDKSRTQVLFVHGVKDTPRAFSALSDLDRSRFQAWFFFYPTGLGLSDMGEELASAIEDLAGHGDTILVAHSMGGLVAREALRRLAAAHEGKAPLKGYLSLATPYGGMFWSQGMNLIPCSVQKIARRQSLYDVQPKSPFLTALHAGPFPAGLPFYLLWGDAKGSGDGTVTRDSATAPAEAAHASEVCHYRLSHVGMLGKGGKDEDPTATEALRAAFRKALNAFVGGGPVSPLCPEQAAPSAAH